MKELKRIADKYPFIYEVDGCLYHIGVDVFAACIDPIAQQYFVDYQKEFERLGRNEIREGKIYLEDTRPLVDLYNKIIICSETKKKQDIKQVRADIRNFLENLSDSQKSSLREQLQDYVLVHEFKSKFMN